jgi:hypothetical protein
MQLSGQHAARVPRQRLLVIVTVAGSVQAAGMTVEAGGRLAFDHNGSAELTSTRNIVVNGTLSMRPASTSVQAIRFAGAPPSPNPPPTPGPTPGPWR